MADPIPMRPAEVSVFEADPETGNPGVFIAAVPGTATAMIVNVSPHSAQTIAKALLVAAVMVGNGPGVDLIRPEKLQ